jgi:hypothetical protein
VKVRRVERNPWIMAAAASPLLLAVLAGVFAASEPLMAIVALYAVVGAILATLVAWLRNPRPRFSPVEAKLEGEVVSFGAEEHAREALRSVYVIPRGERARVLFERGSLRRSVEVEVDDEEAARELLRTLRLAPEQTVGRFVGLSRLQAYPRLALAVGILGTMSTFVAAAAALTDAGPLVAALVFFFGLGSIGVVATVGARIDVGADGLLLRWMGRERFVAWGEVESTELAELGSGRTRSVRLLLVSGERIMLPIAAPTYDGGRAAALVARIESAREAARSGGAEPTAFLRRGDEPHRDWVKRLRASLALGAPRSAALSPERLWRVVEDAAQPPAERLAAAVALGKLDDGERARLGRIAAATAAPRLRVALEHVDEDEAIAEALAALEQVDRQRV